LKVREDNGLGQHHGLGSLAGAADWSTPADDENLLRGRMGHTANEADADAETGFGVDVRFGLLSAIAGIYVLHVLTNLPLSAALGSWKGGPMVMVMVLLAVVAFLAFRTSLVPGQPRRRWDLVA
jgi:hypothetical protein